MKKISIKRGVSEDGNFYFHISRDNNSSKSIDYILESLCIGNVKFDMNRDWTTCKVIWGGERNTITHEKPFCESTTPLHEYKERLQNILTAVKNWQELVKYEESIEFEV